MLFLEQHRVGGGQGQGRYGGVQPLSGKQDCSPNEPQVDVIFLQVIQALGSRGVKGSAMVMAEDKDTGLLLRIHSLKVVRAYDEHGNEFSTLKGMKILWTIESGGNAKGTDILRIMTLKDSPYNTEPIL